ncbi:MAG: flagellin [Epsilonproteobacteria bacterium]|nr:flagellin [Campylobacterota bacterium]OIO16079.1 MAG: flagellin [Helicobacteraceae bacterium CG1_02_36_14]PIP10208.1 MAG: flagellin [Sulfurimonas sp. CG23_combo_of_CG06-09_8_20_14_all_36_33]PIS26471.1 MAG: flagellin [Sulfurimonas sp. CG08_land_8_20_14_0_20_36_33]PIU33933.1 MAG: flagellin [Sulfurimonas sp. CG07_land_8_20_14_0_80_36_56]PIV03761.1 MAG: flagellin [Sulfurimonas sp. CG03_land_8_20_14_0_80_36_25]PIV34094.1 MAG: flagellin [Sulfurimonas sp. CG02_land_8_20_14_3_00_36_67]PIV61394.1 
MSFQINTNVPSLNNGVNLNQNTLHLNRSVGALSSGSNLSQASFDAAGLAIANKLMSQVLSLGQEIMNANDSIGMIQVADGGMQAISDNTDRIRVLTLQASNGTMNADSRATIQKEIDALVESSDDIANSTSYNGIALLDGSNTTTTSGADARSSALFASPIDVTTEAGRSAALDTLDTANTNINDIRATLGASQNQLESRIQNISLTQVNVAAAESQMRDVDFAAESANFSKNNILSQIGSFVQSQANASASNTMRLFQ